MHLLSAGHRRVVRQNRQQIIQSGQQSVIDPSTMDRFLQDVLQHHPHNYQDTRAQPEMPAHPMSPEMIRLDEVFPEDTDVEKRSPRNSESVEGLPPRPRVSQNSAGETLVRPSVIQKLERGQQQSLELNKIKSGVRINPAVIGQPSNSGRSIIRPPVICNVPARCLPGSFHARPVADNPRPVSASARPVAASTSRIPLATRSESVSKHKSSKADKVEQLDEGPRNHMPSHHPKTSSVSHENPKESSKKSVHAISNKLLAQKGVKCQGETKFRESKDTKSPVQVESSSKVAVNPVLKLNTSGVRTAKRISGRTTLKQILEGATPKRISEGAIPKRISEGDTPKRFPEGATPKWISEGATPKRILEGATPKRVSEGDTPKRISEGTIPKQISEFATPKRISEFTTPKRISEFATPKRISEFATPKRISEFATPKQISEFATPKRISEFATPKRISEFATPKRVSEGATPKQISEFAIPKRISEFATPKRILKGAIPVRHGKEFLSQTSLTREEKGTIHNKPAVSKPKGSVSAKVKFDRKSLQSSSISARKAVQELHLWKEEQSDDKDESSGSQESETSFDFDSFSPSPIDLSEVTARKTNVLEETHDASQDQSDKACYSEISSEEDFDDTLEVSNQSQVLVEEKSPSKAKHRSLVDESYDSSGSEVNFDHANSKPTSINPPQPDADVIFPNGVPINLVDRSYGSGSSKGSAASVASLESIVESSTDVTKKKHYTKPRICLVDKSYGSSYSKSSSDSDGSSWSAADHPQATGAEGSQKGRPVQAKNKKCKPSNAKAHLACVSLEAESHRPQRDVGGIKLQKKKKAGLVDMNCESHDPDTGFHADAQLVADESQVAVKEVNPQAVDIDLGNKSVQSSISGLSFESHDCFYQSAKDEPEGHLGEVNHKELNVGVEAKISEHSSSELTFDSDSPLLSITERSQLDVERLKEDPFKLEAESCGSNSYDLTFDSDIPACSVVDQPQVAVYQEEPVDLENESDCVSEITFDSDIPLHSGNDQPEVAVKEVIIQEEEYIPLERKNAKLTCSEINSDSYTPLHSVTNPPEVAIKKLNSQKEEQVHLKNKENEPADSKLNLNHDIFLSTTGHPEALIHCSNFQKEECVENMQNEASVSGTHLDSDTPLLSVIQKPQAVVKNIWHPKEKQADFQGKRAKYSASEIKPNIPHSPVTEPQVSLKKKEKKKHIEKKTDKYGDSERTLSSDDFPHSMPENPPPNVWQEDSLYPEGESPPWTGFEANVDVTGSFHPVFDQPPLFLLKKKHVTRKDKRSRPSGSRVSFGSADHLQSPPEHDHRAITTVNLWPEEAITLQHDINAPSCSKAVPSPAVSLKSATGQPAIAIQLLGRGKDGRVHLGYKSQNVSSEMILDSDFLVQAIIDRPYVAVEKSKGDGKNDQSGDSEGNSADTSAQPAAKQPSKTVKETAPGRGGGVDVEGQQGAAESCEVMPDSNVHQPVTGQTKVIQKKKWKKHLGLKDKNVRPSDSKINSDSNEPSWSMTNEIQEPLKEADLPEKGHVYLEHKGYEPDGSEIIYVSNVPLQSSIQHPQSLRETHASLEMNCSDPHPSTSFDSNELFQSVPLGQLPIAFEEMNLKEDHVYLGDKSYRLIDFETSYDSDVPVQFVVDSSSHASAKDINGQKEAYGDLENESYPICSEAECDSSIYLQPEADPTQVACKDINFQNTELFDLKDKAGEPGASEMMDDADVSFQIIVNQSQSSDGEADPPEVVFVDEKASDSDCDREVISDPDDPPPLILEGTRCINELIGIAMRYCHFCGSELRFEASSLSVSDHSKKSFRILTRNKDYIILGDSHCQSCGCEIDFNMYASNPCVSYQSQGAGEEGRSYGASGAEGNVHVEGTSQKTNSAGRPQKDPKRTRLIDKSWESSGSSAVDGAGPSGSMIPHIADGGNLRKPKRTDPAGRSGTSHGSGVDAQRDPSTQADAKQPQKVVKKTRLGRKVSFDTKEYHYYPFSSVVACGKSRDKEPKVIKADLSQPDLEALSPACASAVGDARLQKVKGDGHKAEGRVKERKKALPPASASAVGDARLQKVKGDCHKAEGRVKERKKALPPASASAAGDAQLQKVKGDGHKAEGHVKERKKGRHHGSSHDNHCSAKKVSLKEEKKPAWPHSDQNALPVQTPAAGDHHAGETAKGYVITVASDKPRHHNPIKVERPKQNWNPASQSQAPSVHHATQTNIVSCPLKRKILKEEEEEEEESPKKKCFQSDRKWKQEAQSGAVEIPIPRAQTLEPGKPSFSVWVGPDPKWKREELPSSSKKKKDACDNQSQVMGKRKYSSLNDPLPKKVVVGPLQKAARPAFDSSKSTAIHCSRSDGNPGARGFAPAQSLPLSAFIKTARYKLQPREGSHEPWVLLEDIDNLHTYEAPKYSNFQVTPSNDGAKACPKPVINECLESKKKKKAKKEKTHAKPSFPESICKAVILQEKSRGTSEKQSIWIRIKANAIIKKYTLKYSVLLNNRHQTKATVTAEKPKKKISDGIKLKKKKRKEAAKMFLSSPISAACFKEQIRAGAGPSEKCWVLCSSSTSGRSKPAHKTYRKKVPILVRECDLRSSCCVPAGNKANRSCESSKSLVIQHSTEQGTVEGVLLAADTLL
ncbi:DBF4-type zinc finger-containing protein 2 isoform X2 [Cavia porcellus]|uniref:DBF4-type zinc finger-containing protein 2 isoform X2 n=1 Tax=Cavia porcellus TaxID=10141 RepID=UPI002FE37FC2